MLSIITSSLAMSGSGDSKRLKPAIEAGDDAVLAQGFDLLGLAHLVQGDLDVRVAGAEGVQHFRDDIEDAGAEDADVRHGLRPCWKVDSLPRREGAHNFLAPRLDCRIINFVHL
jgi:hypothetical protein